ncbi:MAG: hypothetical protein WAW96_04135 [Alphaproteobacteria bacterium]
MKANLFYEDDATFLGLTRLRGEARREVQSSTLVCRAADGDWKAAEALHRGFWPFVKEFQIAIDHHRIPRLPLRQKFGEIADQKFEKLAQAMREMKREEGNHAAHWQEDASCLGLDDMEGPIVPSVQKLIADARTADQVYFFSVLAGTELIAEELSAFLVRAEKFLDLFSRKRWTWGEVHLIPHGDGGSHLDIDLDLARAYLAREEDHESIGQSVIRTIELFGQAAREVEVAFASKVVASS